jgi:Ras-related protein Rab-8A
MSNQEPQVHLLKIALAGDSGVGKTSIMSQYINQIFDSEYLTTIGVNLLITSFDHLNHCFLMNIWDTAGLERYSPIVAPYFRNIEAIIIVFSFDNHQSFVHIKRWIDLIKKENLMKDQLIYVIVGNKCDLPLHQIEVSEAEINDYIESFRSKNHDVTYIKTSAKTDFNLSSIFIHIGEQILRHNEAPITVVEQKLSETPITVIEKRCPTCALL